MTKNIKFVITRLVFPSSKCSKIRFRPGDPAGGAYDALPNPPSRLGGGYPLPITLLACSTQLGASVLRLPSTRNPVYASAYCIPYRRLFAVYTAVHIDI